MIATTRSSKQRRRGGFARDDQAALDALSSAGIG
jgi:hypothetical protein